MERLKTKAFQSLKYALPGRARKLILLTKVAKIDIPTAHDGIDLPPVVNWSDVLFLKKKLAPNNITPEIRIKKMIASSKGNFMGRWF
jgi:hypothetical protein